MGFTVICFIGLYFHELKDQRKGEYSVRVTENRRVTWRMDGMT